MKLTITKRIIFALFSVLFSVNLWGQSLTLLDPDSPNSESNPYLIGSTAQWNTFAYDVTHLGYSYAGKYIKLTADIEVSEMVGDDYHYFSGTFDGNYNNIVHTLTFTYDGTYYIAPFNGTSGATIKNLKVEGNIIATDGCAGGLICYSDDVTYVENVTVSVNISSLNNDGSGRGACGGFAAYSSNLEFLNCVYNGTIKAGEGSGGFSADAYYGNTTSFTNCIFDPAEGSNITSGYILGPVETDEYDNDQVINCYYTVQPGTAALTAQGTLAYQTAPADDFTKAVTYNGYTVYGHVGVTLPNVAATYEYDNGNAITVNCAVTFDDPTITSGDYTVKIYKDGTEVSQVKDCGKHDVVVAGTGSKGSYYGAYSQSFYVVKPLSGNGEEGTPYIIASAEDWISFAYYVNSGNSYSGKYVHLTNSITVSTMVGTPEHPFSGIFTGQKGEHEAYTLTFNYGTSANPTEEEIVAPFRYTDGATIISLIVDGAIYTNVGKEAGLIGVNTYNSTKTTVRFVINKVNFICYEDLLDAEGGGYAYDGSGISFIYSSYEGTISANNYHGGFCGNANTTTTFSNCLFNPTENGFYWAQNFVYNMTGTPSNEYFNTCYYTVGHNQEESEQGTMVFVNSVPEGNIGHKLTTFHEKVVYEPVTVEISGVNKRYIYDHDNELLNISDVVVKFDGVDAIIIEGENQHKWCSKEITDSNSDVVESVYAIGKYTLTINAPDPSETSDYLGTVKMVFRVIESSNSGWVGLQNALLDMEQPSITLTDDITAGGDDAALVVESGRTVTINLNGHTINRNLTDDKHTHGGQVLKINAGATVVINGRGTITGGRNWASSNTEHAENSDGGGIYNMGHLTLNGYYVENQYDTIFITDNKCVKLDSINPGVYRTARGGGIYSGEGSTLIVNGCVIRENRAQGGGGGIFADKANTFTVDHNTVIRSNRSLDKGGGVRINNCTTASMTDCKIYSNTVELFNDQSASNGGGIHLDAGTLNLTNCTIDQNYASKFGGGIYQMGGTINATNCAISFNRSYNEKDLFEGCGGGVCVLGGTFYMIGGTITGNSSYISDGGGIYVASGKTLKLKGSVNIYGNWTYNDISLQTDHITNVYLAGANDKITISASIAGASVGVSKNGGEGRFTSGLNGRGTTANFVSDYADYQVLPDGGEAKLGVPAEMPSDVDDLHLPEGMEKDGDEYVIKVPFTVDQPVVILRSVRFEEDGCIIITENGILRVPSITNSDPLKIIIDDGGQIIFTGTPGDVAARVKKEVEEFLPFAYDNWYLISSPINNPVVSSATNIVVLNPEMVEPTPGYDLYRFNEAAKETDEHGQLLQWENYRASHADFTTLANGRGYLYRSCQDYTVTVDGNLNVGNIESYTLTNNGGNVLKGFNVIGNPYPHNIKKDDGQAIPNAYLEDHYYVLNPTGCQWVLTDDGSIIPPFTGILVQANDDVTELGQTLTIYDIVASSGSSKSGNYSKANNIWFTIANDKYDDRACVEFKEGHGLNKIAHINEEVPMLYIRHNDEDFASVDMNPAAKAFDLNFEAKTTGYYTLNVQPRGDYRYLHLYDKLTGEDVDMLLEKEYSFIGSVADNADRFIVRFELTDDVESPEVFAYQSGNEIIVSGEGELQVFDVMGRLVMTQRINGVQTIAKPSTTGVYILKLNEKTQKIVVR